MAFFLTQKAVRDLKNIARYTQLEWGIEQRNVYLKQLDDGFHSIDATPSIGLNCDYIKAGYQKYRVGRHLIFYRHINDREDIEIVRVLHERMDIESYF